MKARMIRPRENPSVMFGPAFAEGHLDELSMLRSEVEILADEDAQLMKIVAAAALFVSKLQGTSLPEGALNAASTLAKLISELPEDTLCDALDMLGH